MGNFPRACARARARAARARAREAILQQISVFAKKRWQRLTKDSQRGFQLPGFLFCFVVLSPPAGGFVVSSSWLVCCAADLQRLLISRSCCFTGAADFQDLLFCVLQLAGFPFCLLVLFPPNRWLAVSPSWLDYCVLQLVVFANEP